MRASLSTGSGGPVELATNFPLRTKILPTAVAGGPWEPVFPYACKACTSAAAGPVESRVVRTFHGQGCRC